MENVETTESAAQAKSHTHGKPEPMREGQFGQETFALWLTADQGMLVLMAYAMFTSQVAGDITGALNALSHFFDQRRQLGTDRVYKEHDDLKEKLDQLQDWEHPFHCTVDECDYSDQRAKRG